MSKNEDASELSKSLDKILNSLNDDCDISTFNNKSYAGFDIAWSVKGWWFGHLTFGYDKEKDQLFADNEAMGRKSISKIIELASSQLAKALLEIEKDNTK